MIRIALLMVSLAGCQSFEKKGVRLNHDEPTYHCWNGIVFVQWGSVGIAWLPNNVGNPVTCVEFEPPQEIDVPELVP